MSLEKPLYKTTQSSGLLPLFFSTLCFNGKLYTGGAGRNKKEAEQLAARTVIQSILVESSSGRCLTEIIKSKGKLYAAMHKIKDSGASTSERRVVVVPPVINKLPMPAYSGTCQGQLVIAPVIQSSVHELKKPKVEPSSEATTSFTGAFQPAPHVHQPHPNQVQNDVPLAQPSSANFGGTSQGIIVQNEVPLALPSAVNVRDSSQGIVFVQHEVPLALPSAVNVRDSSQGIVVVQNEVPLTDPSAVGSSSQGTVVTSPGVKRPRKKNKRGGKKRFRNEGSQFSMPAVNQTTSCSVAH
ncbi:uncharacterized protein LOC122057224 [Macadamia integrifolia]|uniref:uncharacterized protein LOC122057224 n=1 Tax=Macadamia integrifolia TaxID=60698 RepID=UPI001C5308EB|nr:uncharacterized protein LOC122057224 [Macadamia integrifolia]